MTRASNLELAHRILDPVPSGLEIYRVGPARSFPWVSKTALCFACGKWLGPDDVFRDVGLRLAGSSYAGRQELHVHLTHFRVARRGP